MYNSVKKKLLERFKGSLRRVGKGWKRLAGDRDIWR